MTATTSTSTTSIPAKRPVGLIAAAVGLGSVPALGGLCTALVAAQARMARRAPRPYVDAIHADGLVGTPADVPMRVTWLGDSLAAGLGVDDVDHTPARVVASLLGRAIDLRVLAVSGSRSIDVLTEQVPALDRSTDLVVLCVGANDVATLVHRRDYARNLDAILDATAPIPTVVLSLPDMAMPDRMAQPLRSVVGWRARWFDRARARTVARHAHVESVDIASRPPEVSRRAGRAMLCADKFHPGPDAYRVWAERIAEACHRLLGEAAPALVPIPVTAAAAATSSTR
jgi:lysophospholipase L1-like esterase